jgi:hypothetical protein
VKIKKLIFIFVVLLALGIFLFWLVQEIEDAPGKRIIHAFMDAEGMNVRSGTKEYSRFMKGILLGEYPELTGKDSVFIKNEQELSYVLKYASRHMYSGIDKLFRKQYKEPDIQEASPPPN